MFEKSIEFYKSLSIDKLTNYLKNLGIKFVPSNNRNLSKYKNYEEDIKENAILEDNI